MSPPGRVREALSNAKDHEATRFWFRTARDARNQLAIVVLDDGEGLTRDRIGERRGEIAYHVLIDDERQRFSLSSAVIIAAG